MRRMMDPSFSLEIEEAEAWDQEEINETERKNGNNQSKGETGEHEMSGKLEPNKWANVFHPYNTPDVLEYFENDPKLIDWINKSSEPLYYAIKYGNLDMIRFFGEMVDTKTGEVGGETEKLEAETRGKMDWKMGPLEHSPLHLSMMVNDGFNIKIVEFFLNHPKTNLEAKDVSGENLFHIVFLVPLSKRISILKLLFQEEYFKRISHLLNIPNKLNETPFDFAFREDRQGKVPSNNWILKLFEEKGALSSQDLNDLRKEQVFDEIENKNPGTRGRGKGRSIPIFSCNKIFTRITMNRADRDW